LNLLIDPFLTGNPAAVIKPEQAQADFILVSHGHGDHVGDTIAIAKRTGATVICNYEISEWMLKQGVAKAHGQQHGGRA
jgi:L-ascorbate metabolism protein UlaG (beta-lactamase superfamily)